MHIDPFNKALYDEIRNRWDRVAKPLGSLGRFEHITAVIGAAQGTADIDIKKRAVVMMCADNGIVAEGVSQSGQDVTAAVAEWMGRGESSVCKMAKRCGADTIPVDIGINMDGSPAGVLCRKVMKGTGNFAQGPAMTEDECRQAIDAGIGIAADCSAKGYRILATGEMGIGNTTTSSALAASMLGIDPDSVTGRGAGLSNEGLERKKKIIREALDRYSSYPDEAADKTGLMRSSGYTMKMLSCIGGLDIAGLAGVFIGGAMHHIPVVIDGFISAVAALAAERLVPGTRHYMIASHMGREPGMKYILDVLGLEPVIDADLALGEGTGAVMLFPLLDTVLSLYSEGLNFDETTVEQYRHFDTESRDDKSAGGRVILIIGYPGSGKSAIAEDKVLELSEAGDRIYAATMIPYGEEGLRRIERHRRMRSGKGFETVEVPFDAGRLTGTEGRDLSGKTVLLECVSNLAANELFERHTDPDEAIEKLYGDIRQLAAGAANLVIVSNHFEAEESFDEETLTYVAALDKINEKLKDIADEVMILEP